MSPKTSFSEIKRIQWLVDPFEKPNETQKRVTNVVRQWATLTGAKVEPLYALSPDQLELSSEAARQSIEQYRPAAEKALQARMSESGLPNLLPGKVLIQAEPSLRRTIEMVNEQAKVSQADLLILGSHGRKGVERLFLGSFAESLILTAERPVIVIGQDAQVRPALKKVLYPTDLNPETLPIFRNVVALCKTLKAELVLHHAIPHPIEPLIQSGVYLVGGGWTPVPLFLRQEEESQKKAAESWLTEARNQGVSATLVLDSTSSGIVQSILNTVDQQSIDCIAMVAQTGRIASALLGSVTRQVVRHAHCPVWISRHSVE